MTTSFLGNDLLVFTEYREAFHSHRSLARLMPGTDVSLAVRVGSGPVISLLCFTDDGARFLKECSHCLRPGEGAIAADPAVIDQAMDLLGTGPVVRVAARHLALT